MPKKKPTKAAKKPAPKKVTKKVSKPAPKRAPVRKQAPKKAPAKASPRPVAPKRSVAPSAKSELAKRMALFSQRVVKEEEAPVAVRTFNEARAGIEQSKQLDIRSGSVTPVKPAKTSAPIAKPTSPSPSAPRPAPPPPHPDESSVEDQVSRDLAEMDMGETSAAPKVEPLTGRLAVPKRSNPLDEQFEVGASAKKGKKGAPPTKEDFGKIELRMQRGSKDEAIANASPDYLQRSFNKAAQKGKVAAASAAKGADEVKPDEFEVAMDKGTKRLDAALTDFGDIEIAQQTRRGAKKVGKLDVDAEDPERSS